MKTKPTDTYKILVASGVNLDLLGSRQPEIYGMETLKDLEDSLNSLLPSLETLFDTNIKLITKQTNSECYFLELVSECWDGIVVNAGAWTHTSLALSDRLAALDVPFVEVHISNLANREEFRKKSYLAPYAIGIAYGFGLDSYHTGLFGLLRFLKKSK